MAGAHYIKLLCHKEITLQSLNEDLNPESEKDESVEQKIVKRPWGVYLVAFWVFFGLSMAIKAHTTLALSMFDLTERQLEVSLHGTTLFVLYLTCGVILLNKTAIHILLGVLALVSVSQLSSAFNFFIDGETENKFIALKVLMSIFSGACAFYLLRSEFRVLSDDYRKAKMADKVRNRKRKDFDAIQKHVSKQLKKSLK